MNTAQVLVIGYGNTLRGDDGVGVRVADLLWDDGRLTGAQIIACPQLSPELAELIGAARLVVLIDARADDRAPGVVKVDSIEHGGPHRRLGSHSLAADELVDMAHALYGRVPRALIVSVGATQFGFGHELSPAVAAAVPRVIDVVVGLIESSHTDQGPETRGHPPLRRAAGLSSR